MIIATAPLSRYDTRRPRPPLWLSSGVYLGDINLRCRFRSLLYASNDTALAHEGMHREWLKLRLASNQPQRGARADMRKWTRGGQM